MQDSNAGMLAGLLCRSSYAHSQEHRQEIQALYNLQLNVTFRLAAKQRNILLKGEWLSA